MAVGNRGFAEGLTTDTAAAAERPRLPPRTALLQGRGNRIAELAKGDMVVRQHELVDPVVCRIWEGHNRDYAALDESGCADLIESFKAQRRQEVPAIVRRVRHDERHQFEVICGARRHWTATWMRAHGFPDFRFLVEPRELNDEEAFRIADLENRSRRDLSDLERARDYARAVARYYDGNQARMCERLEVSNAWLSRYLVLARLPAEILDAFGSPHVVRISHAATLGPLLNDLRSRDQLVAEATTVSREQRDRHTAGLSPITAQAVVQRLSRAVASARRPTVPRRNHEVRSAAGDVIAHGARTSRGGGLSITVPSASRHAESTILDAVGEILRILGAVGTADEKRTRPRPQRSRSGS